MPKTPDMTSKENKRPRHARFWAAAPLAIAAALYIFIWSGKGEKPVDPWFKAAMLVDSAAKTSDMKIKAELMAKGGSDLRKLAKKYDYHARVHFLLGYYYMKNKIWDSAQVSFKKAIDIDSGATINPIWIDAARAYSHCAINESLPELNAKNYEGALKRLEPKKTFAYRSNSLARHFGEIYKLMGKLDSAEKYLAIAIRLAPKDMRARKQLSLTYFISANDEANAGRLENAIKFLQRAAKITPGNAEAHFNIGLIYSKMGDRKSALQSFSNALHINPGHARAKKAMAVLKNK
jgi:tetratricopeptide (TPR) repeat protein